MANPIGTKEQREELRRLVQPHGPRIELDSLDAALDGLDIAEEMAELLERHDPGSPTLRRWRNAGFGAGGTRGER